MRKEYQLSIHLRFGLIYMRTNLIILLIGFGALACAKTGDSVTVADDSKMSQTHLNEVLEQVRSRQPGTPCFPDNGTSCDGCGPHANTHLGDGYLGITGQTIEGRCYMQVLISEHGKASVLKASCDHEAMATTMTSLVTTTKWDTVSKQGLSCRYIDEPFDYTTHYGFRF